MIIIASIVVAGIVTIYYVFILRVLTYGWLKNDKFDGDAFIRPVSVSVVVACRNEEKTIQSLLTSLSDQVLPDYVTDIEIIIVDDCSDDRSCEIVENFKGNWPVLLIKGREQALPSKGKKDAIKLGVNAAKGELLAFTDADCLPSRQWLFKMLESYQLSHGNALMVLGAVVPFEGRGLLADLQLLEMLIMMGVAGGSAKSGIPVLCNGANLLIEKGVWMTVADLKGGQNYISGDDMFLLEKVKRKYGSESIVFCNYSHEGHVKTLVPVTWKGAVKQRFRWVSKSPGYSDTWILLIAATVFLTHLLCLACFAAALFNPTYYYVAAVMFSVKFLVDLPFVVSVLNKFGKLRLMFYYIPVQILGLVYVSFTGTLGVLLKPAWKGRSAIR